jgi:hypothetical protein
MARKTLQYKVTDEGRDLGKVFLITEMPATQGERWAIRAFLAMGKNGVELPDDISQSGFAGIASYGLTLIAKLPFDDAEILMEEMFRCVQMMPNPSNPEIVRSLVENDIEEIATRFKLRIAAFKLHADFSKAVGLSTLGQASASGPAASSNT